MRDPLAAARHLLNEQADDAVLRDVARLEVEGKADWIVDVEYVALVASGTLRPFLLIHLTHRVVELDVELIAAYL